MEKLHELFQKCISVDYIHISESADYFIEEKDGILYIYLQSSNGVEDWINNFDFPPVPYKKIGGRLCFCHKGFLRVWRAVMPRIEPLISDSGIRGVITVGYSHGGAVAALCHEYVITARPDLIENCSGFGFGAPRVLWGRRRAAITDKWRRFTVLKNIDDIVTHLPPRAFGFFHPGPIAEYGEKGKYSPVDAHRPENILAELEKLNL